MLMATAPLGSTSPATGCVQQPYTPVMSGMPGVQAVRCRAQHRKLILFWYQWGATTRVVISDSAVEDAVRGISFSENFNEM